MKLRRWYSICSSHQEYNDTCGLCDCGVWKFVPFVLFGGFMWLILPGPWKWWQNLSFNKSRWLKSFRSHKTGQQVTPFPNLKS